MGLRTRAAMALCGLLASAAALAWAPRLMPPDGFAWIAHTTSESAAQGVPGAWLARLGFVLFGLAVLWLAWLAAPWWGRLASGFHMAFGAFMLMAAVFSSRPWDPNAPFNAREDLLHSVSATAMGFAFAFGIAAIIMLRLRRGSAARGLDLAAITASVVLPLSMALWPGYAGALQRTMFSIAYAWYGAEAVALRRRH